MPSRLLGPVPQSSAFEDQTLLAAIEMDGRPAMPFGQRVSKPAP